MRFVVIALNSDDMKFRSRRVGVLDNNFPSSDTSLKPAETRESLHLVSTFVVRIYHITLLSG